MNFFKINYMQNKMTGPKNAWMNCLGGKIWKTFLIGHKGCKW